MLRNHIKIAIRVLWKNKLFSLVNIISLSLSMAVGVILFTFVKANHDTDHFHPQIERIVRILTEETKEGEKTKWATAPMPLAAQLENVSSIENYVKVRIGGSHNLQTTNGDVPIDVKFSESSFFNVFGFELLSGNAESLDNSTSTVFLAEATARKVFGDSNALGQTILIENLGTYTVEGIIQDPPLETHLPIEALLSINSASLLEKEGTLSDISQDWGEFKNTAIYAKLRSDDQLAQLNATLQNYNRELEQSHLNFSAQPLENITPRNEVIKNDFHAGVDSSGINTQLLLILAITLLSAFNYISLTLARAFSRAQEVGVRKTIGATRKQIIGQFLTESTLISLFALLFTLPFVIILKQNIPDLNIAFSVDIVLIIGLLIYAIITGLIAGAFPSWLLSSFQPIQILRKLKNLKLFRGVVIYKVLLVIQFSVTIMLMILVVILADYERKHTILINDVVPSNVLTLDLKGENYDNLKNEINQLSQVENTLATNWYYKPVKTDKTSIELNGKLLQMNYVSIDPEVIKSENILLTSGHNFPENMPQNSEQFVLVNEAASELLKSKTENLVGQDLRMDSLHVQIIGIMPNEVISQPIPLIYRYLPNEVTTLAIKINPNSEAEATSAIQSLWKDHFPEKTANIQNFKHDYIGESSKERIGFFGFFALIVMIIAGLGIWGIASYSVEIRTKELGIKKVLGANKIRLVWTITKGFSLLILIAGFIGVPAGIFGGDLLRQDVGSLVDVSFLNISVGFVLVAIIGLVTVLSQTIRAGNIEPVKVLKAE